MLRIVFLATLAALTLGAKHAGYRFSARKKEEMKRRRLATLARKGNNRSISRARLMDRGRAALKTPPKEAPSKEGSARGDPVEAARAVESEIWKKPIEYAHAFNPDGSVTLSKSGDESSVYFSESELLRLKDTVFTHNHPSGLKYPASDPRHEGTSFSMPDVGLSIRHDLAEMRAVTPVWVYSLKRPTSGWESLVRPPKKNATREDMVDTMLDSFRKHNSGVRNEFARRIFEEDFSIAAAEAAHHHEVWSRVSGDLGLDYTRSRR